jgi:hypothetical protein
MFMRKRLLFVFVSLFLVAGTVHAQSVTLKADIPFDFVVGNTIMHAGRYTIQPTNMGGSAIELRSLDDPDESILVAPCTCASGQAPHETELVFQVSGGHNFLWRIWTQGYGGGRELSIRRSVTQVGIFVPPHTVVVAAAVGKG